MKIPLPWLVAAMLSIPSPFVHAAGGGGGSEMPKAPQDPAIERANAAIDRRDWPGAQGILRDALAANPGKADYHNLYAFSLRKGPSPDMSLVFKHYNEALRIDPRHRAAHEYLGEAYLQVGNVEKAKEHLAVLDKLCFLPCSEYSQLKKAVAEHESGGTARPAAQRN
jgi:tetratricopeptide (TPR) repeat protein